MGVKIRAARHSLKIFYSSECEDQDSENSAGTAWYCPVTWLAICDARSLLHCALAVMLIQLFCEFGDAAAKTSPRARPDAKNDARRAGDDVIVHLRSTTTWGPPHRDCVCQCLFALSSQQLSSSLKVLESGGSIPYSSVDFIPYILSENSNLYYCLLYLEPAFVAFSQHNPLRCAINQHLGAIIRWVVRFASCDPDALSDGFGSSHAGPARLRNPCFPPVGAHLITRSLWLGSLNLLGG